MDENNQIISEIDDKNPPMSGVFIFSDLTEEKQNSKHRIIVSHEARQNTKQTGSVEHRYLELLDGKIYTFENNRLKELLEFETYEIVLSAKSNEATLSQSYKALPSMQLLESPNKRLQAEFYLRLSSPICILMASFLALVFAQFQPRTSGLNKIFLAIVVYIAYNNSQVSARYWVADSSLSAFQMYALIHLTFLCLLILTILIQKGIIQNLFSKLTLH